MVALSSADVGLFPLALKVVIGEVAVDAVDCQDKVDPAGQQALPASTARYTALPQFGKGGLLRAENNMDKDVEVVVANQLHDDLPILVVQDVSKNLILDPAGDLQPWAVDENERSDLLWLPSGQAMIRLKLSRNSISLMATCNRKRNRTRVRRNSGSGRCGPGLVAP